MKTKTKLLSINQILIDEATYPRDHLDYVTLARYAKALSNGANFPNVVVALLNNKYYLVDGRHRLQANLMIKVIHVQAEILTGLDAKQIYVEAVKRNIAHGRQFGTKEVADICITLKDWKLSQKVISEIVQIPAKELTSFVAKRSVRITESSGGLSGMKGLRAPLQNIAGQLISEEDLSPQEKVGGSSQVRLLEAVIALIENNWIDFDSELIKEKCTKLYNLLHPYQKITV